VVIAACVIFFAATYISDPVTSGSAYGFQIGQSKQAAIQSIKALQQKYPNAALDATYGSRAGDHITVPISRLDLTQVEAIDHWEVELDGAGEFVGNIIRLNFKDGRLVHIYRHRQYFELP
jgi:hypothetical protein